MRSLFLACGVAFLSMALAGCCCPDKKKGGTAASEAATSEIAKQYECTACKDKVTWMYNSKGLPTGYKKVEHTCPACKKPWGANLSTANTCAECAKAEKICPLCQAKQGG